MEKEKTAQELFQGSFQIWAISTAGAAFKARLQAEDLRLEPGDIDSNISLGVKNMVSDEDRIYLNATPGQVQNFMRPISAKFFGRGLYAIPEKNFLACKYGLEKIREAQRQRVEDFLLRYPDERRKQTEAHPNLANEEWPTADEIRRYFKLTWKVFKVSAVTIDKTDSEEEAKAKEQFKKELAQGYEELKDTILGESYKAILSAIDTIQAKLQTGDITLTNFKRPKQIIEQYLSISAIFDLKEIQDQVTALKNAMEGTTPKDLREKPLVSAIFADKLKDIGAELESLTGYSKDGRRKRTIDLDEEDPPAAAVNS